MGSRRLAAAGRAAWFALAICLAGCVPGVISPSGPPQEADPSDVDRQIDGLYASGMKDAQLSLHVAADEELTPHLGATPACTRGPLLLRFAWVSDVQIRDPGVTLGGTFVSRLLNNIASSEYDPLQATFSGAAYLAQIVGFNKEAQRLFEAAPDEPPLAFLVHTGDAVDSNTVREMYEFVAVSGYARFPWLNVIGNHDVAAFGNFDLDVTFSRQASAELYPIGRDGFLWMHRHRRRMSGFGYKLLPVPTPVGEKPSSQGTASPKDGVEIPTLPPTWCHGFDQGPRRDAAHAAPPDDCSGYRGYYHLDVEGKGGLRLRLLALDTNELRTGFQSGSSLGPDQARWLEDRLAEARDRPALVFAHHRPDEPVLRALERSGHRRVAVFTGHTHGSDVATYWFDGGRRGVVELNTGSVLEYPQRGRIVELRGDPADLCIVSRTTSVSANASIPKVPWTNAHEELWQRCAKRPGTRGGELAELARCAHVGALRDRLLHAKRLAGSSQDDAETVALGNVFVPLPPVRPDPPPPRGNFMPEELDAIRSIP